MSELRVQAVGREYVKRVGTVLPDQRSRKYPHGSRSDRRYHTQRWQRVRRRVLERDNWACRIVAGCTTRASVADHIIPSYPEMPDSLFFDPANLRAGCKEHNVAR